MAPPPPATAVADAMTPPPVPRDSRANVDIMAVTKGFHWPWFIALAIAVIGVTRLGFQIIASPQTAASIAFQAQTAAGKLNAVMTPIGPSGCHCSIIRWRARSDAIVRP